ncbi:MAG: hypothetical protein GC164_15410 [Phycisphaera sp.]|nr:hypothetical protein [Phycisphaera sp.]
MSTSFPPIHSAVRSEQFKKTGVTRPTMSPVVSTAFVTLSRQAGAGAGTIALALAEHLTRIDPGPRPWQAFDRELVEKIADEHRIPATLLHRFEDVSRTWLTDLVEGMSFSTNDPSDLALYHRVCDTVRALATSGRVVLVGRGGVFITRSIPNGVHVFLVAPLEYRVEALAKGQGLPVEVARKRVHEIDANRQAFYHKFWPDHPHTPDAFSLTLNVAHLSEKQVVGLIAPLVVEKLHALQTNTHVL